MKVKDQITKTISNCCAPDCCDDSEQLVLKEEQAIKDQVKAKYGAIALAAGEESCCGPTSCSEGLEVSFVGESYAQVEGHVQDADLGLGCGLPTEFALIKPGDTVVDLGSGAGNDAFIARQETGEAGRVIGIDFTAAMVKKAREYTQKMNFENVEFYLGDIDNIPLPANTADVAVSNCVFNLVPNKAQAFRETLRILKPGAHFSISDIVLKGDFPEELRADAELYVGCVAGAQPKEEYLSEIARAGFVNIKVQKDRQIILPPELVERILSSEKKEIYERSDFGIHSITVYAEKPL